MAERGSLTPMFVGECPHCKKQIKVDESDLEPINDYEDGVTVTCPECHEEGEYDVDQSA